MISFFELCVHDPLDQLISTASEDEVVKFMDAYETFSCTTTVANCGLSLPKDPEELARLMWCLLTHDDGVEDFVRFANEHAAGKYFMLSAAAWYRFFHFRVNENDDIICPCRFCTLLRGLSDNT